LKKSQWEKQFQKSQLQKNFLVHTIRYFVFSTDPLFLCFLQISHDQQIKTDGKLDLHFKYKLYYHSLGDSAKQGEPAPPLGIKGLNKILLSYSTA
jgi:hypothetical protein